MRITQIFGGEMSLEFENVSFRYGAGFGLDDINFKIANGVCTALIGANGSGKTTIGKLCAGILKPKSGRVLISGEDISALTLGQIGARAGYLFQNPERQLFAPTALEDLMFPAIIEGADGAETREKALNILSEMKLSGFENRSVFRLSGGEKQRLAIGGLLMREPRVLILDEPTTGIDAKNRERLGGILVERQKDGVTILLITHDMPFADKYCNAQLTVNEGVVLC